MESGMAKACFLSRRVRRAIVATVPSSLGATLSSPPLPKHYSSALKYRSHETKRSCILPIPTPTLSYNTPE